MTSLLTFFENTEFRLKDKTYEQVAQTYEKCSVQTADKLLFREIKATGKGCVNYT